MFCLQYAIIGPEEPSEEEESMQIANLFAQISQHLEEELCEVIGGNGGVRIERIVSPGHCTAPDFWYDQDEDEFVLLLSGFARLELQDPEEVIDLNPGDYLTIAAHRRHRVKYTNPEADTVWLTVFFPSEQGSSVPK